MLIEASSQTTEGHVYIISGNDDLHVGAGVTIQSTLTDAITTWTGQHTFTVDGTIIGYDECINTIGTEAAQTVIIGTTGRLISGGDGGVADADGVILDGVGSTMTNAGVITSYGSAASVFVRDAGTTTVSNSGTMTGRVAGIWHKYGIGTLVINNTGTVESVGNAILGGASADLVTNRGTLHGTVDLGGGDDVLVNRVGTVSGTVIGTILGGDGNDRFVVGTTAEVIDGGAGFDTLDFSVYTKGIVLDLANPANNFGLGVTGDTYTGIEGVKGTSRGDVLRGDGGDNLLVGNASTDTISGGEGSDTIEGGTSLDYLTGDAGADFFRFASKVGMNDTIRDFASGEDHILLEGSAFGYGDATGAISADDFHTGVTRAASDASNRFIFRTTDRSLWFDADGTGSGSALCIARVQIGSVITAADIWLM